MLSSLAILAALASAPLATRAHIALWHPSMFGWDPNDGNQQEPVNPLYNLTYDQWWMHSYIGKPPASGTFMELPAGGTFHGQVGCNKAWTTYGPDPTKWNATWACDGPAPTHGLGALHTSDTWEDPAPHDVKGCALAIAYESDETKVTPEQMTVFSVNYTCPWKRDVDFQVPANLPACPPGGCICTWNWIHSDDAGSEQIYNLAYRCQVTGATNTQALTTRPALANKCPTDKSNCTIGAKVPFYWLQQERNNFFQGYYDPPFYNGDYGFANGAQQDLFAVGATSSSSKPASSSTSKSVSMSSTVAPTSTSTRSATMSTVTRASSSAGPTSTKASSTAAPTATPSSIAGYSYVGCIADGSNRAMPGGVFTSSSLTAESCAAHCGNTTYFGLEYGTQCFCSNSLVYNTTLDAGRCGSKCAGNAQEMCGGSYALSLWARSPAANKVATSSSVSSSASSACSVQTVTVTVTKSSTPTRRSRIAALSDAEKEARRKAWDEEAERESKHF